MKVELTFVFLNINIVKNSQFGLVWFVLDDFLVRADIKVRTSHWWPPSTVHSFYCGSLCFFLVVHGFFARVSPWCKCYFCLSVEKFYTHLCALVQDSSADVTDLLFCGRGWAECLLPSAWDHRGGFHVSLLSSLLSRCIPLDYHDFHYFPPGSQCSLYDMNSIFLCASTRQNQVKECLNATWYFFSHVSI